MLIKSKMNKLWYSTITELYITIKILKTMTILILENSPRHKKNKPGIKKFISHYFIYMKFKISQN